ncbi:MAG: hypothetical protein GEU95_15675 [Rhizobiales bacterium]|nr:hypothetical protein [Hyphomicrobiales bacterium]
MPSHDSETGFGFAQSFGQRSPPARYVTRALFLVVFSGCLELAIVYLLVSSKADNRLHHRAMSWLYTIIP